jgi:hypothetical protein
MEMKLQAADRHRPASVVKVTYSVGLLYGLFVWSVARGFGGRYVPATSIDAGAAIIYSLLFATLLVVDSWIEKRWAASRRVAELGILP